MSRKSVSLAERIWSKVAKGTEDACWLWTGATNRKRLGYGQLRVNGKNSPVTRHIWNLTFGEIPEGKHILHTCDVSLCCNPNHFRLGSHIENMNDMKVKGRARAGNGGITDEQKAAMLWATWHDIVPYVSMGKLTKTSEHTARDLVPKSRSDKRLLKPTGWKELSI